MARVVEGLIEVADQKDLGPSVMVWSEELVKVVEKALPRIWIRIALLSKEMPLLCIGCLGANRCDACLTCLVNCCN